MTPAKPARNISERSAWWRRGPAVLRSTRRIKGGLRIIDPSVGNVAQNFTTSRIFDAEAPSGSRRDPRTPDEQLFRCRCDEGALPFGNPATAHYQPDDPLVPDDEGGFGGMRFGGIGVAGRVNSPAGMVVEKAVSCIVPPPWVACDM